MYELPVSIDISGTTYNIRNKGDYRMVLDCFNAMNDADIPEEYRVATALIIFYEGIDCLADVSDLPDVNTAVEKMYAFFNCNQPESPGQSNYKLIDWESDSQIICSAINNVARKEIRFEPYIHWWTFMGYYMSVGESVLANVVSIRSKILKGKKLEKYEQEFKRNNPSYFVWNSKTAQEQEEDEWIRQMWNSGK